MLSIGALGIFIQSYRTLLFFAHDRGSMLQLAREEADTYHLSCLSSKGLPLLMICELRSVLKELSLGKIREPSADLL